MTTLKWKRDGAGRQVSTDGRYAVASDGYTTKVVREPGDTRTAAEVYDYNGVRGNEWAAVLVRGNENLDWFDTMREAKAHCEWHAARGA